MQETGTSCSSLVTGQEFREREGLRGGPGSWRGVRCCTHMTGFPTVNGRCEVLWLNILYIISLGQVTHPFCTSPSSSVKGATSPASLKQGVGGAPELITQAKCLIALWAPGSGQGFGHSTEPVGVCRVTGWLLRSRRTNPGKPGPTDHLASVPAPSL